jgi:hypothetical protein
MLTSTAGEAVGGQKRRAVLSAGFENLAVCSIAGLRSGVDFDRLNLILAVP